MLRTSTASTNCQSATESFRRHAISFVWQVITFMRGIPHHHFYSAQDRWPISGPVLLRVGRNRVGLLQTSILSQRLRPWREYLRSTRKYFAERRMTQQCLPILPVFSNGREDRGR